MRTTNLIGDEGGNHEETGSQNEIGGVWIMGHVSKLIATPNQYVVLEGNETKDKDDQEWKKVEPKGKPKTFTGKSKIKLELSCLARRTSSVRPAPSHIATCLQNTSRP